MYSFERNSRVYAKSAAENAKKDAAATSSQTRDSSDAVGEIVAPNTSKAQIAKQFHESQEVAKKVDPQSGHQTVVTRRVLNKRTTVTRADAQPDIDVTKPLKDIEDELSRLEKMNDATDKFNLKLDAIRKKLDELEHRLNSMKPVAKDNETLKRQLAEMDDFMKRLNAVKADIEDVALLGEQLISDNLAADPRLIRAGIKDVQNQWASLDKRARQRIKDIEDAMNARANYDKALADFKQAAQDLADWLDIAKNNMLSEEHVNGDLDTVCVLVEQHKAFEEVVKLIKPALDDIKRREQELLANRMVDEREVKQIASSVRVKSDELNALMKEKSNKLQKALEVAQQANALANSILEMLAKAEQKLLTKCSAGVKQLSDDENVCKQQLAAVEEVTRELNRALPNKEQAEKLERFVLGACHPDGELPVKYWSHVVASRWAQIEAMVKLTTMRLEKHTQQLKEKLISMNELIKYLCKNEVRLLDEKLASDKASRSSASSSHALESQLAEHQSFADELRRRDVQVDEIVCAFSANNSLSSSRVVLQASAKKKPTSANQTIALGKLESAAAVSFASYSDKYRILRHSGAQLMLNKWRVVWQLLLDNMQQTKAQLELARQAEQQSASLTDKAASTKPEDIVAAELKRLTPSSMKVYHVGGNKYRFGDAQQLRPIRVSPDNKVEVRTKQTWSSLEDFLQKTRQGQPLIKSLA